MKIIQKVDAFYIRTSRVSNKWVYEIPLDETHSAFSYLKGLKGSPLTENTVSAIAQEVRKNDWTLMLQRVVFSFTDGTTDTVVWYKK